MHTALCTCLCTQQMPKTSRHIRKHEGGIDHFEIQLRTEFCTKCRVSSSAVTEFLAVFCHHDKEMLGVFQAFVKSLVAAEERAARDRNVPMSRAYRLTTHLKVPLASHVIQDHIPPRMLFRRRDVAPTFQDHTAMSDLFWTTRGNPQYSDCVPEMVASGDRVLLELAFLFIFMHS